jgi:hypothetical protein
MPSFVTCLGVQLQRFAPRVNYQLNTHERSHRRMTGNVTVLNRPLCPEKVSVNPGTNGRQVTRREGLPYGERSYTIAQRIAVVAEPGIAVEIIEVAFQSDDQRTRLHVTSGLSAGEWTVAAMTAGAAQINNARVRSQQVGSRIDGCIEVCAARSAPKIQTDITPSDKMNRQRAVARCRLANECEICAWAILAERGFNPFIGATVKGALKPDQRSDNERASHSDDDY